MRHLLLPAILFASLAVVGAYAADKVTVEPSATLTLKDHVFTPAQLIVPANQKIKLTIKNMDSTSAEFESEDFEAEKVVPANGEITVYVQPLKPGTYGFYDDFHEDTTKGTLVAQ